MAFSLTKELTHLAEERASPQSWTDFYINMIVEMEEIALYNLAGKVTKIAALKVGKNVEDTTFNKITDIANMTLFAKSLMEQYDSLMKNGKTIIGGVPLGSGNVKIATGILIATLSRTNASKTGDLLRDIGPVFQAYWAGAQLSRMHVPNIPCIGSIKNLTTNEAVNLSPGIWTPITVPPIPLTSQFLLSFIISAQLHLLTLGGFFFCNCQYPPPAPPAPGILPYFGYVVDGFSNPIKTFKGVKALEVGVALAAKASDVVIDTVKGNPIHEALTAVISDTSADAKIRDAAKALQSGTEGELAQASQNLNPNAPKRG
jgi:hypothetical protein